MFDRNLNDKSEINVFVNNVVAVIVAGPLSSRRP